MLIFMFMQVCYFVTQRLPLKHIIVHSGLDDMIPFVPAFIIFYVIWYLYIPVPMLYMCFKEKNIYYKQCVAVFSGMFLCIIGFLVLPTALPAGFRPTNLGNDVFSFICKIIYANDKTVNVCPSLHCYEAVVIHITTFYNSKMRKYTALRISSAVLAVIICISTAFVKQHSVWDVFLGVLLGLIIGILTNALMFKNRKPKKELTTV